MAEIKKPVCATTKVGELKTDFLYAEETKDKIYLYSVNFPEDSQLLLRLQINSNTTGGEMFLYVPIDKDRAVRCFPSCFDKK